MQEEAFKHKCFFNVQCHVTFIGHEMVLRYREKDNKDKGFTILRTWFPPSQIKSVSGKGNTSSGGPSPSNKIDDDALLQASRSLLLPDVKDKSVEEIREMLEIDLQGDMVKIREIKIVSQRPLILCESEKSCREIV